MWMSFENSTILLNANQPMALRHAHGTCITCMQGQIWLTVEGMAEDIVLKPGQCWTINLPGLVLIEALDEGSVRIEPNRIRYTRTLTWLTTARAYLPIPNLLKA